MPSRQLRQRRSSIQAQLLAASSEEQPTTQQRKSCQYTELYELWILRERTNVVLNIFLHLKKL